MSDFGDWEPEDSWCPTDDVSELVRNLAMRVALVDGLPDPIGPSPRARLGAVRDRLTRAETIRRLTDRDRLRLRQLREDLDVVEARL